MFVEECELMRIQFRELRSVEALKSPDWQKNDNRALARMLVIDDNPFSPLEALQAHGYQLTQKPDIQSISEVEKFEIVVCDIRGIGKSFNSDLEGAYVIKEIRSCYPDKYIIMYSSGSFSPRFQPFLKIADNHLRKNDDISVWVDALDEATSEVIDPYRRWKRTRLLLLERGVDIHTCGRLEHQFVNSIQKSKPELIETEFQKSELKALDVTQVGISLASFVSQLVLGAS